jgi:hypothetical protein
MPCNANGHWHEHNACRNLQTDTQSGKRICCCKCTVLAQQVLMVGPACLLSRLIAEAQASTILHWARAPRYTVPMLIVLLNALQLAACLKARQGVQHCSGCCCSVQFQDAQALLNA